MTHARPAQKTVPKKTKPLLEGSHRLTKTRMVSALLQMSIEKTSKKYNVIGYYTSSQFGFPSSLSCKKWRPSHVLKGRLLKEQQGQCPGLLRYRSDQWIQKPCNKNLNTCRVEIDHIIEKQFGGTNNRHNLQALCHECHNGKGCKTALNQESRLQNEPQFVF